MKVDDPGCAPQRTALAIRELNDAFRQKRGCPLSDSNGPSCMVPYLRLRAFRS